jgi:regulator of chromosome condensation
VGIPAVIEGLQGHKVRHIAGGFHHSLACTEDGKVLAWGRCDESQVGMDVSGLPREHFLFDSRGRRRILLHPTVIPGTSSNG